MLEKNQKRLDEAYQPSEPSISEQNELDGEAAAATHNAEGANTASAPQPAPRVTSASKRLAAAAAAAAAIEAETTASQPAAHLGPASSGQAGPGTTALLGTAQLPNDQPHKHQSSQPAAGDGTSQQAQEQKGTAGQEEAQGSTSFPASDAKSSAASSTSAACEAVLQQRQQMLQALEAELRYARCVLSCKLRSQSKDACVQHTQCRRRVNQW